jgi:hypothetical protein
MIKNILILLFLFFFSFSALPQDIGSSWTIKSKGVRKTSHAMSMDGKITTFLKKKQKAIIFLENKVNPNTYTSRKLQFKNLKSGEILYEEELKQGEINSVTFLLKPIIKKYKDSLCEQEFTVVEIADQLEGLKNPVYKYPCK